MLPCHPLPPPSCPVELEMGESIHESDIVTMQWSPPVSSRGAREHRPCPRATLGVASVKLWNFDVALVRGGGERGRDRDRGTDTSGSTGRRGR